MDFFDLAQGSELVEGSSVSLCRTYYYDLFSLQGGLGTRQHE